MPEPIDRALNILEAALGNKGGVKLLFKTEDGRVAYRMKLYRRRVADRVQVAKVTGSQVYEGISPYDALMFFFFTAEDGRFGLKIMKEEPFETLDKDGEPIEIITGA